MSFHEIDGKDVCMVQVDHASKASYVREGGEYKLCMRTDNQTQPSSMKEVVDYVLAPVLAAIGAFAALVTECTIEVEKTEDS